MAITATAASAQRRSYQRGRTTMARRTAIRRSGVAGHAIASDRASSVVSRSATRLLLHALAKPGQRPREARLHSPFRYAERGRRLLAVELEQVPARDDQAIV